MRNLKSFNLSNHVISDVLIFKSSFPWHIYPKFIDIVSTTEGVCKFSPVAASFGFLRTKRFAKF